MHVPIERMIDREGNMMNRVMLAPKQTKEDDKKHAERRKERKKERERKRERKWTGNAIRVADDYS